MVAVLRVLRQEHADLARLLDMVEAQLGGDGAPDVALLTGILDYIWTYPDQYHHPKEDLIYRTLCRHDARLAPAIDDLEAEHGELAIATRRKRQGGRTHPGATAAPPGRGFEILLARPCFRVRDGSRAPGRPSPGARPRAAARSSCSARNGAPGSRGALP